MKKYFYILVLASAIVSCSKHEKRETKYDNGQVKEQFLVKETKDGSFINDGEYKTWFENGQSETFGQYADGKKTGNWKKWYKNGQLESDKNYKIDSLDGAFSEWYESGQKIVEGNYKMDKEVGEWTVWFENGQMKLKNLFSINGDYDGKQVTWHKNGVKESEENYSLGKKEGASSMWDDDGKLIAKREFKENKDVNLPATYKNNSGEKLVLNADETYKLKYLKNDWFSSSWKTVSGAFEIVDGELDLKGFNEFSLQKFNADTIIIGEEIIFIRE